MSAQISAQAAAATPPAPAALEALHRKVQERLGWVLFDQPSVAYAPLAMRYQHVALLNGHEGARQRAELHRGLVAIADAPDEVLRRMLLCGSTTVACQPPTTPHAEQTAAWAAVNAMRPGPSPAELVRQFAARGVTIAAQGGNLHVEPGDRLTEDDRALLRSNKAALLQELARPVVVL